MLENLKAIRDGQRDETIGICFNIQRENVENFLDIALSWPKHSGQYYSPVPGSYRANRLDGTLWKGEQLQLRLELLDFVIGELEKCHHC